MGYKQSHRRYNNNSNSHWYDEAVYTLQVYYRPQPWLQVLRFIYPIIRFALLYIKCLAYGITYVVGSTMSSVILLWYASALAFAIIFICYIVYLRHMIAIIKQEAIWKTNQKWQAMESREEKSDSGGDDDSKKKTANQEAQTTPKSTNVDLSIPGAFAQHSHCSNKRCCNNTECSNYCDIGESTYSCIFVA